MYSSIFKFTIIWAAGGSESRRRGGHNAEWAELISDAIIRCINEPRLFALKVYKLVFLNFCIPTAILLDRSSVCFSLYARFKFNFGSLGLFQASVPVEVELFPLSLVRVSESARDVSPISVILRQAPSPVKVWELRWTASTPKVDRSLNGGDRAALSSYFHLPPRNSFSRPMDFHRPPLEHDNNTGHYCSTHLDRPRAAAAIEESNCILRRNSGAEIEGVEAATGFKDEFARPQVQAWRSVVATKEFERFMRACNASSDCSASLPLLPP
ncbi:hypothetical protein DFH06DRAFT_1298949 [Mycena polygramma]|nr:hypothetical protein DFH06DRAFT_1298949 [Mycena polygramma]